jgi:hypothetical protein
VRKIFLAVSCFASLFLAGSAWSEEAVDTHGHELGDRVIQLGAGIIVPYRVDEPQGRTATLFSINGDLFFVPHWTVGLQASFGLEDRGFSEDPVYLAPGMGFYPRPGQVFEPFIRADVPILLNADKDFGIRGGLGFLWNLGVFGLGIKYSFDVAYFFDENATVLDLANAAAVLTW